ncbi:uncharacterized protein N7506_005167 [Penicillium brevicompactum]|uniref:uncharacterized protein n=1 Tax=Penicillium brevicompactum TaxID=5074 RepID=UPI0025407230|nr:uncharacterized protein N7506_005167 [Penicillium brevicompactum]KAJ5337145.1 hypothetical protein N7506_005167 [Penicillium brevicompactum]
MTDSPPASPPSGTRALWMASSEVDQKALGNFAAVMGLENPFLSTMLYKVLGVSVMLSKKLIRARKLRRLDTTRETRSLQLYHHIIWLSREGLLMLEGFILPMVDLYVELKVLAYKLRASFYHIFVLFHNRPIFTHEPPPLCTHESILPLQNPNLQTPGLGLGLAVQPVQPQPQPSSFLLPALDYTSTATACFNHASALSDKLLPGSHPLRLSVKLEYAAYLHDCLQDPLACRRLAKQAIADVYNAQEGMDDESFADAAEIVGVLGKMVKRGKLASSTGTGTGTGTASSISRSRSRSSRSPSHRDASVPTTVSPPAHLGSRSRSANSSRQKIEPAVPDASMLNPI